MSCHATHSYPVRHVVNATMYVVLYHYCSILFVMFVNATVYVVYIRIIFLGRYIYLGRGNDSSLAEKHIFIKGGIDVDNDISELHSIVADTTNIGQSNHK